MGGYIQGRGTSTTSGNDSTEFKRDLRRVSNEQLRYVGMKILSIARGEYVFGALIFVTGENLSLEVYTGTGRSH